VPCLGIFVKDPAGYMNALDISVPCAVEHHRPAVIDAEHKAYVNYEIYFFSGSKQKEKFLENPLDYCGAVTDPVSRRRFIPTGKSPRLDVQGRPFYFLSDSTMAVFQVHEDSLAWPAYHMKM